MTVYLHMHWHALVLSIHHATHIVALYPGQFAVAVVLAGGIGFGGQLKVLDFNPHTQTTPTHLVMTPPAVAVLHGGVFAPMGTVSISSK